MPARKEWTAEFEEQSVRFEFDHIEIDESSDAACQRPGPKLNLKPVIRVWVATSKRLKPASAEGSVEDPETQLADMRKEKR